MGLALPFDISNMLQIKERPYFKKMISLHSVEGSDGFCSTDSSDVTGGSQGERQLLDSEEAEFQEHIENNCLYCGLSQLGFSCQQDLIEVPVSESWGSILANQQGPTILAKLSGVSGCSVSASQGSAGSNRSTELVLAKKKMPDFHTNTIREAVSGAAHNPIWEILWQNY
ncbi:rapamycin-insensitive companion of mTOR-like [Gouania willdenowi]|uniref:rapamycin-insensitive companion of mTOR-like n=1 Tax=Gouania willdenowi TaxID=441366 RepID=UPI001055C2AF|nr:rapamycin-insensitive companion of mTOR-like [Gouania willdenowi]